MAIIVAILAVFIMAILGKYSRSIAISTLYHA